MSIRTIILIILSLYGVGATIAFIVYLIKYNNLNSKHQNLYTNYNDLLNSKDCSIKDIILPNDEFNNTINKINEPEQNLDENYLQLIQSYDIYNDADFYNKYDLMDEYNDKIIIYSRDLKNCYLSCENLKECYAFTKYNNYCYFKSKYDLNQKNNASKTMLIVKKDLNLNKTLLNDSNNSEDTILFPNETRLLRIN
jgi:uncharacterized membrane protein YgaE (UPF0421/DUF939 family)